MPTFNVPLEPAAARASLFRAALVGFLLCFSLGGLLVSPLTQPLEAAEKSSSKSSSTNSSSQGSDPKASKSKGPAKPSTSSKTPASSKAEATRSSSKSTSSKASTSSKSAPPKSSSAKSASGKSSSKADAGKSSASAKTAASKSSSSKSSPSKTASKTASKSSPSKTASKASSSKGTSSKASSSHSGVGYKSSSSKKKHHVAPAPPPPPSVAIEPLEAPRGRAFPPDSDPVLAPQRQALRKRYLDARAAFNARSYDRARALFEPLVTEYPAMREYVVRELGRMLLLEEEGGGLSRETSEALVFYADQLLASPGSALDGWGWYLRGRALHALGQAMEAEQALSQALNAEDGAPRGIVYFYLGQACEGANRPGDAYVHYVFASQTSSGSLRTQAAQAAARVGANLDPAERGIEWYVKRDDLARLVKKGADQEVLRLIQAAREECTIPEVKDDLRRLEGSCYLKLARQDEGVALLQTLLDEELSAGRPNWETIALLEDYLGKLGDTAGRKALLQRFIASHPREEGIDAWYLTAAILKDEGKLAESEVLLQEVFDRWPGHPKALDSQWLLAWGRIRRGETAAAQKALETMVAKVPPFSDHEARARYWLARLRYAQGQKEAAEGIYRELEQRYPDNYYGVMAGWQLRGYPVVLTPPSEAPPVTPGRGEQPAELGRDLLFPGFDQHLARIKSRAVAGHVEKALELWLMGLGSEASAELSVATTHAESDAQARWMSAAMAHAMGSMGVGIRYGHRFLAVATPDEATPERLALACPMPYRPAIIKHALARGVEPALAAALIQQESTFQASVGSRVGAKGLMQLMPYTGADVARWLGIAHYQSKYLTEPDFNLRLGTEYLRAMLKKNQGSLVRTLASYNAGPAAVSGWVRRFGDLEDDVLAEEIPYKETRHYVRAVLRNFAGYLRTYGAHALGGPALPAPPTAPTPGAATPGAATPAPTPASTSDGSQPSGRNLQGSSHPTGSTSSTQARLPAPSGTPPSPGGQVQQPPAP